MAIRRSFATVISVTALSASIAAAFPDGDGTTLSDHRLFVLFESRELACAARERPDPLFTALGCQVEWVSEIVDGMTFVTVDPRMIDAAARLLPEMSGIRQVEYDALVQNRGATVPNDPLYTTQYGSYTLYKPCLEAAWSLRTSGGTSTGRSLIAVLDSGLAYELNDFANVAWHNSGEIPGDCIDNDGDGIIDNYYGAEYLQTGDFDTTSPPCAPNSDPHDENGHGTHVSSIIGAQGNNSTDMTGTIWSGVKILPVKVLGSFGWAISDLAKGIEFAYLKGSRLMNMSLQGSYPSGSAPSIFDPVAAIIKSTPECMYVVAAGNLGLNLDTTSGPGLDIYPAEFIYDNIVTVGATDTAGNRAIFNVVESSDYGTTSVDLFAPGLGIWGLIQNGNFVQLSGTSQASPEVAALACLYWALNPTASVAVVKKQLKESGRVQSGINGLCVGNASSNCTELSPAPMLGGICP